MNSYRKGIAALVASGALLAGTAYADQRDEFVAAPDSPATTSASALETSRGSDATAQAATCELRGTLRGRARVTGSSDIPGLVFASNQQFIIERYNCTGEDNVVGVKREGPGSYVVRFPNNPARTAVVSAENAELNASVDRIAPEQFRVVLRDISGNDEGQPKDGAFFILLA